MRGSGEPPNDDGQNETLKFLGYNYIPKIRGNAHGLVSKGYSRDILSTRHFGYGLDDAQAAELLQRHGPNLIIEPEKISKIRLFFHQFASPLIYILILAAMITAYLQEYKDSSVIVVVVLFNALIGFFQEYKAEKSVMALKQMAAPKARVLRQGREREIPSELLVPGDVVILESGVKVPADVRLFRTVELRVDEAILTGESLPVEKTSTTLQEENLTPGDQKNMAFLGTVVLMGRGRGVVVETGGGTILGSIAEEVKRISPTQTPLQTKFARFANILGLVVLAASAVLFLLGVLTGEAPRDMFMTIVAAAVAAIPEGLPVVVTITLARSVARWRSATPSSGSCRRWRPWAAPP